MTRRSGEWHLLGLESDPVPATAYDVTQVAQDYTDRATDLGEAADVLEKLSNLDGWAGEAAVEFADHSHDNIDDLRKAETRYSSAASALRTYAPHVDVARTKTWSALQDAVEADAAQRANDYDALKGVDEPTPAQVKDQQERDTRHTNAVTAAGKARTDLTTAMDALREAASTCAKAIEKASDKFDDNPWDRFKGFVRDHAGVIKIIIKILEIVAAIVAVILLIVVIIATAPAWLVALAVGVAVAIVLLRASLVSVGEASWGDLAWDIANLALTVVGGKVTVMAGKAIAKSISQAKVLVTSSVTTKLLSEVGPLAKLALRVKDKAIIGIPGSIIQGLKETKAITMVDDAVDVRATITDAMRVVDRDFATQLGQIKALRNFGDDAANSVLDGVEGSIRTVRNLNFANAYLGVDAMLADVVDIPMPSDLVKGILTDIGSGIDHLSWRIATL